MKENYYTILFFTHLYCRLYFLFPFSFFLFTISCFVFHVVGGTPTLCFVLDKYCIERWKTTAIYSQAEGVAKYCPAFEPL
jgi:hypothetical protein